jgi:hypothetical protein
MLQWRESWSRWYQSHAAYRKLHWVYIAGETVVKVAYWEFSRTFDLVLLPVQAMVLWVFNTAYKKNETLPTDTPSYSLTEVSELSGLSGELLLRTIHSLCGGHNGKFKLLLRSSDGSKILPTDSFSLNLAFNSPIKRVRNLIIDFHL